VIALSQAAKETLPLVFPNVGGQFEIVVYGIALIVVLLFVPRGVAGSVAEALSARRGAVRA
jgi:branched-chain amino acid transport system permease protein